MNDAAFWIFVLASLVLNVYVFIKQTVPILVEAHQRYDRWRVECDGYTLPWFLCGLYWVGADQFAPERMRKRQNQSEAAR